MITLNLPSPMENLTWPDALEQFHHLQKAQGIEILCKRDDLIHPIISGNKWRKLSATIDFIKQQNIQHVLSFGGAYSNHLHALAYVCKQKSIRLSACIRGDYSNQLTPMLKDISEWGADILFLSKVDYKQRINSKFCEHLQLRTHAQYLIPEGGSNEHVFVGMKQLYTECLEQYPAFTHIVVPVASAGTMAGLVHAAQMNLLSHKTHIIGIAMLKGKHYLEDLVCKLLDTQIPLVKKMPYEQPWNIMHDYHHGGYAKSSQALLDFVEIFKQTADSSQMNSSLYLEPVYSGKVFYALSRMIEQKIFPTNSKVIVLHTGGLQGLRK